jgi:hypothetical protein
LAIEADAHQRLVHDLHGYASVLGQVLGPSPQTNFKLDTMSMVEHVACRFCAPGFPTPSPPIHALEGVVANILPSPWQLSVIRKLHQVIERACTGEPHLEDCGRSSI